jgi:hypothetical protein
MASNGKPLLHADANTERKSMLRTRWFRVLLLAVLTLALVATGILLTLMYHMPSQNGAGDNQPAGPAKPPVKNNLAKSATSRIDPSLRSVSNQLFRVAYSSHAQREEAELVLRVLTDAHAAMVRRLARADIELHPGVITDVLIHDSTGDFTAATGAAWWSAAVTNEHGIELQPVDVLRARGVLESTLRHEYTHVVVDTLGHGTARPWLSEGLAIYVAGEGKLLGAHEAGPVPLRADVETRMQHPPNDQDAARALHIDTFLLTLKLVRTLGEVQVWKDVAAGIEPGT